MVIHISQDREIFGHVCGLENVPLCLFVASSCFSLNPSPSCIWVAMSNIVVLWTCFCSTREQHSLALSIRLAPNCHRLLFVFFRMNTAKTHLLILLFHGSQKFVIIHVTLYTSVYIWRRGHIPRSGFGVTGLLSPASSDTAKLPSKNLYQLHSHQQDNFQLF